MKKLIFILIVIALSAVACAQQIAYTNITIQKAAPTLFLNGTNATLNFYNGDVTLQQSSNLLTLAGGDFSVGSNNYLGTGSLGNTSNRLLKGWFTNLEITNMPTVNGVDLATALGGAIMVYPTGTGIPVVDSGTSWGTTIPISGSESLSTENYGSTGTGDIVLSIGSTLTTVTITDVIRLTPTADPPSGATEGMIYADTDHHLYYYNGTTWVQLDN